MSTKVSKTCHIIRRRWSNVTTWKLTRNLEDRKKSEFLLFKFFRGRSLLTSQNFRQFLILFFCCHPFYNQGLNIVVAKILTLPTPYIRGHSNNTWHSRGEGGRQNVTMTFLIFEMLLWMLLEAIKFVTEQDKASKDTFCFICYLKAI